MWDYTDKVLDHFKHPRNVGVVPNPDGVGEVGSLACGDALKLTFKLGADGNIAEAKFQTFGCASAIASSSALTEMIKGMSLDQAAKVTNQDIANYLGGLPEQKMHCSVLGREALEVAIGSYRAGRQAPKKVLEGRVVCKCFGVTEEEIKRVVRENNLLTTEQVTNYCKAGGGCGNCLPEIEQLIAQVQKERQQAATAGGTRKLTILQKVKLIEETLEREVRPMLQHDGGDIELVDLVGDRVLVSLRGTCAGCNIAQFTMKDVVEAKLREFVSPALTVEEQK